MIAEDEDGLSGIAELVPVKTRTPIFIWPLPAILLLFTGWCTLPGCHVHNRLGKSDPVPEGTLAFLTTRDGQFEIYTMDLATRQTTNLTRHPALDFWTSWSADGRQLLFYSDRDGNKEIYRMDADGSHPVNLTRHPAYDYLPSWSPDGRHIVFSSNRDHEQGEIYRMNEDGSGVVRLTFNEFFEEVPTWSPDGNKIIFTRQILEAWDSTGTSNGEIFIMDKDGNNEQRLTVKEGYDSGAKFSPDGRRIAFYGTDETGNYEIWVMQADGTGMSNVTRDPLEDYSPDWSPDGEWLAYTSGTPVQYDVWVLHLATGKKIRLTHEPKRNESPVWKPRSGTGKK